VNRSVATVALLVAAATGTAAFPAAAALREVAVGNFYYDDATPGDGMVEADQGDQLRFTVYDGGPGTPHTVEVDELGIHSGSLAAGETFTTPALDTPGTYTLYCQPHQNRGHRATLVVRAGSTATTSAPSTAAPTTGAPTTAAPSGSPTTAGSDSSTAGPASTAVVPGGPAPGDDTSAAATTSTLAPVGRGEADERAITARPVDPDSLEAALGRPAARKGPWTRSIRLALLVLMPMLAAAAIAATRGSRRVASDRRS